MDTPDRLAQVVSDLCLQVEDLARQVRELQIERPARTDRSSASWDLVTEASVIVADRLPAQVDQRSQSSIYNELAEQIPQVPDFAVRACSALRGGSLGHRERAERAWSAGWWARFTLQGQIAKPRPTGPIDLANTIYVVLRAPEHTCPLVCTRAADYRFIVQNFTGDTISHGFPSVAEARIYCQGAGVIYPSSTYQWSPQRSER